MNALPTKTGAFIVSGDSLVVVIDGANYTINKSSSHYNKVKNAVIRADWETAVQALESASSLKGDIWWNEDECMVYYGSEPLHHSLAERIPTMLAEGFDTKPMVAFLKNLFDNPAPHAIEELYDFMEKNALPITADGCFLAYKKVREDYKDCHTGTFDNSVGQTLEMGRGTCDPVRSNYCSTGFHFCGISYLSCFGGERVMVVKVNPKDVTSIPADYNFAKGRCCTYEVVDEYIGTDVPRYEAWTSSVAPSEFSDDDEFEETPDWDEDECCQNCGSMTEEGCTCCEDDDHNDLYPEQTASDGIANPVTKARVSKGLTQHEVAEALDMPLSVYQSRVEAEGRFFRPATVGRLIQEIEALAASKK